MVAQVQRVTRLGIDSIDFLAVALDERDLVRTGYRSLERCGRYSTTLSRGPAFAPGVRLFAFRKADESVACPGLASDTDPASLFSWRQCCFATCANSSIESKEGEIDFKMNHGKWAEFHWK